MPGDRKLLRIALAMVASGSLLIAVRPSALTLAVGVPLQGALVGFFPLLVGILRFRAPERNRIGISLLVGVLLIAIGVGGLVAGALSEDHAEAGLWTAVPVAVLAVVAGLVLPDSDAPRGGRFHYGRRPRSPWAW
jgi:predicted MFS family arabinose efflux permease